MNFFSIGLPSFVIKKLPILFNMPDEILAEIIYETDTIEERENCIFTSCFFFYISKKYKLKSSNEVEDIINQNIDDSFSDFLVEIAKRIIEKDEK